MYISYLRHNRWKLPNTQIKAPGPNLPSKQKADQLYLTAKKRDTRLF